MNKDEKAAIIKEFATSEKDVGSTRVQIVLLTKRIAELTEHLKIHKKDYGSQRGLVSMVNRRRKLLNYLNRQSHAGYVELIEQLGLRR